MKECNCHRGPEVGKKIVGCPPKVININHPAEPVLFHRVDIPAAMGDDTTYPPENGLYKNVLLVYEANNHTYLYNSDGIPTSLSLDISEIEETLEELGVKLDETVEDLAQETTAREGMDEELQSNIDAVAQDLEDFKNSPDVVDIVPTYAALQAYDTSKLGDNDEVRVLADETHDGASAYYRWDKDTSQWEFIGITGPYYTKSEIDTTVQGIEGDIEDVQSKIGQAKILTSADYNWNSQTRTAVEPFDCIALWLLESGVYSIPYGITAYTHISSQSLQPFSNGLIIVSSDEINSDRDVVSMISLHYSLTYPAHVSGQTFTPYMYSVNKTNGNGRFVELLNSSSVRNDLTSTGTVVPLAANQGRILNDKIEAIDSSARVLSANDYDWPTSNPDGVAIWKLPYGAYRSENGIKYYTSAGASGTSERLFLVFPALALDGDSVILRAGAQTGGAGNFDGPYVERISPNGTINSTYTGNVLTTAQVVDNLTSSYTLQPLSANQGRALNNKIIPITPKLFTGDPGSTEPGSRGQLAININAGTAFICTNSSSPYQWHKITSDQISSTDWDALWS